MRSTRTTLVSLVGIMLAAGVVFPSPSMAATVTEKVKLTAPDGRPADQFGTGVAVSGDTILVGAPHASSLAGPVAGAGYVFVRNGPTWTQQAKLVPSGIAPNAWLGFSAALDGDTAVLGATFDTTKTVAQGSAYVFTRSGGIWTQQAKLTAPDGSPEDLFGFSVAVDGDTIVVGANGNDAGIGNGHAYVFTRHGQTWTRQATLTSPDGADGDHFGVAVAVSRNTALVGALDHDVDGKTNQGAVYAFTRTDGAWTLPPQTLTATDGKADDEFGHWVDIEGDTAIIGSFFDDVGDNKDQGSAYMFTRTDGTWTEQIQLTAKEGAPNDQFGRSVALDKDTVIVGAQKEGDGDRQGPGAAYRFTRTDGVWSKHEQEKLIGSDRDADPLYNDTFGVSVGVSGDTAVVGANFNTVGPSFSQGAAYVFCTRGPCLTRPQRSPAIAD